MWERIGLRAILTAGVLVTSFAGCERKKDQSVAIIEAVTEHFTMSSSSPLGADYLRFVEMHPNADVEKYPFVVRINPATLRKPMDGWTFFWWIGQAEANDRVAIAQPDGVVISTLPFVDVSADDASEMNSLARQFTGWGKSELPEELRSGLEKGELRLSFSRGKRLIQP